MTFVSLWKTLKQAWRNFTVMHYGMLVHILECFISLLESQEVGRIRREKSFSRLFPLLGDVVEPCLIELKDEVFGQIQNQVPSGGSLSLLEIGAGAGPNLRYYPEGTHLNVVDPNAGFMIELKRNLKKFDKIQLANYYVCCGEDMSQIPSNSIDAVVTSCVFCSVSDIKQVLKEIHRVLVPGGKHYFIEHGLDFQPSFTRWLQQFLLYTKIWESLGCGCRFKDTKSEFEKAAIFREEDTKAKHGYLRGIGFGGLISLIITLVSPYYFGVTTKN